MKINLDITLSTGKHKTLKFLTRNNRDNFKIKIKNAIDYRNKVVKNAIDYRNQAQARKALTAASASAPSNNNNIRTQNLKIRDTANEQHKFKCKIYKLSDKTNPNSDNNYIDSHIILQGNNITMYNNNITYKLEEVNIRAGSKHYFPSGDGETVTYYKVRILVYDKTYNKHTYYYIFLNEDELLRMRGLLYTLVEGGSKKRTKSTKSKKSKKTSKRMRKIYVGPRGGKYIKKNGRKIYLNNLK